VKIFNGALNKLVKPREVFLAGADGQGHAKGAAWRGQKNRALPRFEI